MLLKKQKFMITFIQIFFLLFLIYYLKLITDDSGEGEYDFGGINQVGIVTLTINSNDECYYNVQDLIKNIIYKINEKNIIFQHKKVKYIISLKDCEDPDFYKDNYELRNYETKDFSKYPFDLPLSDIKDTKLYFVSKNCLNLMIRKY